MMAPMLLAAAAAVALVTLQTKTDPDLGIAETLAQARRARISNLRHALAFTIPAEKSKPLAGRSLVRFTLADAKDPLVLDYAPHRAGVLRAGEANRAAGEAP